MIFLPYGRQTIEEEDIAAVVEVLRGDWLTTGPTVERFEKAFAEATAAAHAVAVNSGTAALHAMMHALRIGPGDEVVVPALTFAATANAVHYQGGTPVFADVDPETLLLDPVSVRARLTGRTKAIVTVDYAGQPCDYSELQALADEHGIALCADACHSLGATYRDRKVGSLVLMSAFSLHPVKPITSGEGGMVTTDDPELAIRMRTFRNHGITSDFRQREAQGSWFYEIEEVGYNYRLTDLQCALGLAQLGRLAKWTARRQEIAALYDRHLSGLALRRAPGRTHAYHIYVVRVPRRGEVFAHLRERGIGVNVHYVPVHLHPFYRMNFGTGPGLCPQVEKAYEEILTLPVFPTMNDEDVERVVSALREVTPLEGRAGGEVAGGAAL